MISKDIEIINKLGLHARAAAQLVRVANRFKAEIKIIKNNHTVDAKSIMGILLLAASKGTVLTLVASGEDEEKAIPALVDLINDKFGEE
jgi:phosphocarrier protein